MAKDNFDLNAQSKRSSSLSSLTPEEELLKRGHLERYLTEEGRPPTRQSDQAGH